jgi:Putative prokaryotic signal transducing protein
MAEYTEVIATFKTGMEAQVARMILESEGIEAVVSGDVPNAASFGLFGPLQYTRIELSVGASEVARAQSALRRSTGQAELDSDWEDSAESAVSGWLCLGCDTEVPLDQEVCPECGTSRSEQTPEDEER